MRWPSNTIIYYSLAGGTGAGGLDLLTSPLEDDPSICGTISKLRKRGCSQWSARQQKR